MILVDDGLAVRALAGQTSATWPDEVPSVAWAFYVRLLTVLRRNIGQRSEIARPGKISRLATDEVIRYASAPPPEVLQVVDPRPYAALAVDILRRHGRGINRLAADFLAAAIHHQTPLHVIEGNVGRNWQALCNTEGVELRIVAADE